MAKDTSQDAFRGTLMVHALPGSGKTAFTGAMMNMGVFIFDTDDLLSHPRFFKSYLDHEAWKLKGDLSSVLEECKIAGTIAFLVGAKVDFCITNTWGPVMLSYAKLRGFYSVGFPPEILAGRLIARGSSKGDLIPKLVNKWHKSWAKYRSHSFTASVEASRELHLSDYLGLDSSCFRDMEAVKKAESRRLALSHKMIDAFLACEDVSVRIPTEVLRVIEKAIGEKIMGKAYEPSRLSLPSHFSIRQSVPEYFRKRKAGGDV